ncbi:HD-GYP domain-containing protein [Sphingomonas sp. CL5.1]|uniref:HD-GYP domain-containing protein n=1 Tax=Sphingomonas sp. CL5.1 TaxID=2653203 RepID=UPI00158204AB|nr:HD-GYP domain-containing protein [Sphingomonas sp. CL5.1]QKR99776.1 HD-GYP domain-containing protein [Sphingomonas sp. CL5.1]
MIAAPPSRKRIATRQLRLGMYISGIDGNWLDYPFWKRRFLLTRDVDLEALRESAIRAVIIDTGKGLDVLEPTRTAPAATPEMPSPLPSPPTPTPTPTPAVRRDTRGGAPRSPVGIARVEVDIPRFSAGAAGRAPVGLAEEFDRAREIVSYARRTVTRLFDEVRLGKAIDATHLQPLADEIAASVARNRCAMSSIVRLKSKDEYTYMHSIAVSTLMVNLAGELGLTADQTREAALAGLLHDVGKMAVPNELLQKPGALTDKELRLVQTHPVRGHALLTRSVGVPAAAADVCLHHHEKIDGTGYPHRLAGDEISLLARMGAVCDVYDAVTSERPYKAPWTPFEALVRMQTWNGHFDPEVLGAFIRSIGIYPVGTLVRLKSGVLAVVKEQTAIPAQPLVRVFYSITNRTDIPAYDLDLSHAGAKHAFARAQDAIVSSERPGDWLMDDWETIWPGLLASPAGGDPR